MKFRTFLEFRDLKGKPPGWGVVKPDFDWSSPEKMPKNSDKDKLPFDKVHKMNLGKFLNELKHSVENNLTWLNDFKDDNIKVPEVVFNAIHKINDEISSKEILPIRKIYRGSIKFEDLINNINILLNKNELESEFIELNDDIYRNLIMSKKFI